MRQYGTCSLTLPFFIAWFTETMATATVFITSAKYASDHLGASGVFLGVVVSAFALSTVFGNSFAGWLSDTFDRRRILASVMLWNCMCSFASATAPTLYWYIGARFVAGMFGVTSSLAYSYVGTLDDPMKSSTRYALVGGIASLSFIIVPLIASHLTKMHVTLELFGGLFHSGSLLFLIASSLSFTSSMIVFFFVPKGITPPSDTNIKQSVTSGNLRLMLRSGIAYIWAARLFSTWAQVATSSTLLALCRYCFGRGTALADDVFSGCHSIGGLTALLSQLFLFPLLDKRLGPYWSFRIALMIMLCGIIIYTFALTGEVAIILVAHGLFWVGAGVVDTSLPSVLRAKLGVLEKPNDHVGIANGVAMTCKSFSLVCSPMLSNWLFEENPTAVYLQAIGACCLSIFFAFLASSSSIRSNSN